MDKFENPFNALCQALENHQFGFLCFHQGGIKQWQFYLENTSIP